jgi:Na+-driven multidrug efflux pump
LKYYLKTGLTVSAVGSVLITGLSILLGKPICALFGTDAVTTEYIIKYLPRGIAKIL